MFRDRPLTWLFIAATMLLDVVIACGDEKQTPFLVASLLFGFTLGQVLVLGAWLAVGKLHRLTRGALFVGGQVSLVLVVDSWKREVPFFDLSKEAVTLFSFLSVCTFCTVVFFRYVFKRFSNKEGNSKKFQFPLIELFGWMIVVALASLVIRGAEYVQLITDPTNIIEFLGTAIVATIIVMLFSSPVQITVRSYAIVAVVELIYLSLIFYMFASYGIDNKSVVIHCVAVCGVSHLYVALWTFVQRLDEVNGRTAELVHTAQATENQPIIPDSA